MIRRLSDHERNLWLRVARTVRLSPGKFLPEAPAGDSQTTTKSDPSVAVVRKAGRASPPPDSKAPKLMRAPAADLSGQRKVRRGQTPVDARLDLHGHTQDSARQDLIAFVHREHARGAKCLLVITGKGRAGGGVLRKRFIEWLESADIRPLISGYAPSHPRHGGEGAFYLMLKRRSRDET